MYVRLHSNGSDPVAVNAMLRLTVPVHEIEETVIAIVMAMFLILAATAVWLLVFPSAREGANEYLTRMSRKVRALVGRASTRAATQAGESSRLTRAARNRMAGTLFRYRWPLLGALALLGLPPLVVLLIRNDNVQLESYETGYTDAINNSQIVELLNGERLVPPPALPPEVFVIAEAERQQLDQIAAELVPDKIVSADRRWNAIDAAFQQRVLVIYTVMKQRGYEMALVEGYRSPARQAELAAGGKATRAKAGQSCHQYGLAVDSAILKNGKLQWDMNDRWVQEGYFLYGELAEQAGLTWGGNWRSIKDYVHIEAKAACRDARRRAGYG